MDYFYHNKVLVVKNDCIYCTIPKDVEIIHILSHCDETHDIDYYCYCDIYDEFIQLKKLIKFKNLKKLILCNMFNDPLPILPQSLTELVFGNNFNQKVDNLPQKLICLIFGNGFNEKVNNLPQNLICLTFGSYFNKKVNYLPKNLKYLTFCDYFNQSVDNLPKNLKYLTFGSSFNQSVDNLPKNLTYLTFGYSFNQQLNNLPKKLKFLQIKDYFQSEIILPTNLKHIFLTNNNNLINNIPEHIKKISIHIINNNKKKIENLPPTIKEIVIITNDYNIYCKKFEEYIKIPFGAKCHITKYEDYILQKNIHKH